MNAKISTLKRTIALRTKTKAMPLLVEAWRNRMNWLQCGMRDVKDSVK
jgi:hypothetical protein